MFYYQNKVTGKQECVLPLPLPNTSLTKIVFTFLFVHFVRSTSSVMSGANTLARKQPFEDSPNSGVESIFAASFLSQTDKKRPLQLLQGCPSSLFLGWSMIQQHPIEWIFQLLILFIAMHSQSALLNALSFNSYSNAQESYLLLILLLIRRRWQATCWTDCIN